MFSNRQFCCIVLAVILFITTVSCETTKEIESKLDTESGKILIAESVEVGSAISVSVMVVWGDNIQVHTMDEANWLRYNSSSSDRCDYLVSLNNITTFSDLSSGSTQGFKVADKAFPIESGLLYVAVGFREEQCACTSCRKQAEVSLKITVPGLEDNEFVKMGITIVSILVGWALLYMVYQVFLRSKQKRDVLKHQRMLREKKASAMRRRAELDAANAEVVVATTSRGGWYNEDRGGVRV